MSYNDILFSRGVSTASIVASGTKMAVGVISNPLSVSELADVDFQIFGSRGLLIPATSSTSVGGVIRFNPTSARMEVDNGTSWDAVSVVNDLPSAAFAYIGGTTYVVNKNMAIIPEISNASTASLVSIPLDIQDPNPGILLRNLSSASGTSSIFMMGGTGNVTVGSVNGYELKTTTTDSTIYGSSLKINPITNSALSTTMNSITLTPYGMEIVPAVISITGSITDSALKVRGSAHTTQAALLVDKEDIPGVLPASSQVDANKVATFNYATMSVMDILASGKVKINNPTLDGFLSVRGISVATVPNYIASIEQGTYSGTNISGMYLAISTATVAQNIAVFDAGPSGASRVSAARIDGAGNMFVRNNLSVGGTINGNLSASTGVIGTLSSASIIASSASISSLFVSNLSVSSAISSSTIAVTNLSLGNIVANYTIRANGTILQGKNINLYDGVDNTYMRISGGPNNGDTGFIQGYTAVGAAYPINLQPYGANVGIGLAPSVGPSATLHVAGDAYITRVLGGTSTTRPTDSIVNAYTTTINGVGAYVTAPGRTCFYGYITGTSTLFGYWNYNGTAVGTISTDGSTTTYGTTSDYRLKTNVSPMPSQLERISKLKPVEYNWIKNNSRGEGFLAHELQEVFPQAVYGEKDKVDEDGNPVYQNIDVSFIVPSLVAAVQELKELVQQQSQEIAFLKSQLSK